MKSFKEFSHTNPSRTLTESGNIFKDTNNQPLTGRIKQADIAPTVKWLERITQLDLTGKPSPIDRLPSHWLGSTGRKPDSGDLDLLVNARQITKAELIARLEKWAGAQTDATTTDYVKKSGVSVHFLTPIAGDPSRGYVQTDFMFVTNPQWSEFIMSGGDPGSLFKGADRFVAINSVASFFNYKITQIDGMVNRDNGALISNDPNAVAQKILSPRASIKDLISVESILKALENDTNRDAKLEKFRQYLSSDPRVINRDKKLERLDEPLSMV